MHRQRDGLGDRRGEQDRSPGTNSGPTSLPDDPSTGAFVDAFGNQLRMLAVANPDVPHETFAGRGESPVVFDRERRSDGYGIVRVDHADEAFVVECWPRAVDPTDDAAERFPGWPYRLPFDETDGRER